MKHLLMAGLLATLFGCTGSVELKEGGLYAIKDEDGSYSVSKILKLDDEVVHVRMYSNRFDALPTDLDPTSLYMAGLDKKPEERLGIGHAPMARAGFLSDQPVLIKVVPVTDDELEGYRYYMEAMGTGHR
jgi:hypothetical protein